LIGAILDVSKGDSGLSQKSRDLLKDIDQAVHIQVYVTPTCPYCPPTVRLAHRLAIESDMIWSDMVESNEFVPLAQKYGIMSVPKIIINDRDGIAGSLNEELFVAHVLHALTIEEPLQPR
jgi:glutaredoxin-like protein